MKIIKILASLLLLAAGSSLWAVPCDSTVWYAYFDLLKVKGVNRLPTQEKPTNYPYAEVCYEHGLPKEASMFFSKGYVSIQTFEYNASIVCSQSRFRDGNRAYWEIKLFAGDSVVSFSFLKNAKPSVTRWKLLSRNVTLQNQSTWIGPAHDDKAQTYNVEKLMAHPQKLLSLIPDTLGNEFFKSVWNFVNQPDGGYAIETSACYMDRNAQKPYDRLKTCYSTKACYEFGEGVDCSKFGPWLLNTVREDSVTCND